MGAAPSRQLGVSLPGDPSDPRAGARDFKALCANAKVPPKRLHDLRHAAATMMLASDLDPKTAG
jgi:integrase